MKTKIPETRTGTVNSTESNSNCDNDISDTIQNLSRLSISKLNLPVHQSDETYISNISEIYPSAKGQEVHEAKTRELNNWREQNVYEEVPNKGQQTISKMWVIKPKVINGQHSTKARLCARGFEEQQCFQTDSPTCSREGIIITLATIASHKWHLYSLDIKTAFLQGKQI